MVNLILLLQFCTLCDFGADTRRSNPIIACTGSCDMILDLTLALLECPLVLFATLDARVAQLLFATCKQSLSGDGVEQLGLSKFN